jgi:hypothetical protein
MKPWIEKAQMYPLMGSEVLMLNLRELQAPVILTPVTGPPRNVLGAGS